MPTTEVDKEKGSWLRTLYQTAHSDIRWAKEQGWRVVNWALLLFAALLAIARYPLSSVPATAFAAVDALVLLVAMVFLVELHLWAAATRRTAAKIEKEIGDLVTLLERRAEDRNHYFYLVIQLLVVIAAFVLAVIAHCQ